MDLDQAIANGTLKEVMNITSKVLKEPRELINAGTILPPGLKCCVCSHIVKDLYLQVDCNANRCYQSQAEKSVFIASLIRHNIISSRTK